MITYFLAEIKCYFLLFEKVRKNKCLFFFFLKINYCPKAQHFFNVIINLAAKLIFFHDILHFPSLPYLKKGDVQLRSQKKRPI